MCHPLSRPPTRSILPSPPAVPSASALSAGPRSPPRRATSPLPTQPPPHPLAAHAHRRRTADRPDEIPATAPWLLRVSDCNRGCLPSIPLAPIAASNLPPAQPRYSPASAAP